MKVLHLIDASLTEMALESLRALRREDPEHQVLILADSGGYEFLAPRVGGDAHWAWSRGWADVTSWSKIARLIRHLQPSHLQCWSLSGAMALTASPTTRSLAHLAYWTRPFTPSQMRLWRLLDQTMTWQTLVASATLERQMLRGGISPDRVTRIRPGVDLSLGVTNIGAAKKALGLAPQEGPVILLGGDFSQDARLDHSLWAAAILQQIFPATKVIVRPDYQSSRRGWGAGLSPYNRFNEFMRNLPDPTMIVTATSDTPWRELTGVADLLLVTAEASIVSDSQLAAMASGVPIIATAVESVSELIEHDYNGILALPGQPRVMAQRLEGYMSDSTLRWRLTDKARADLFKNFSPSQMLEAFRGVYRRI